MKIIIEIKETDLNDVEVNIESLNIVNPTPKEIMYALIIIKKIKSELMDINEQSGGDGVLDFGSGIPKNS